MQMEEEPLAAFERGSARQGQAGWAQPSSPGANTALAAPVARPAWPWEDAHWPLTLLDNQGGWNRRNAGPSWEAGCLGLSAPGR